MTKKCKLDCNADWCSPFCEVCRPQNKEVGMIPVQDLLTVLATSNQKFNIAELIKKYSKKE